MPLIRLLLVSSAFFAFVFVFTGETQLDAWLILVNQYSGAA